MSLESGLLVSRKWGEKRDCLSVMFLGYKEASLSEYELELNRSRVTVRTVMKVRVPIFTPKFKLQLKDCSKCSVSSLAVSVCLSLTVCVGLPIMRIVREASE